MKGGIFAMISGGGFIVYGPEGSFLEANNSIGLALAMNIPVLMYLLKTEQKNWARKNLKDNAVLFLSGDCLYVFAGRLDWDGCGDPFERAEEQKKIHYCGFLRFGGNCSRDGASSNCPRASVQSL